MTKADSSTDSSAVDRASAWERGRRAVSWSAGFVFVSSFVALLGLSATRWWTPDNPWIAVCDLLWRVSGCVFLIASFVPYVIRAGRQLGAFVARTAD